jgi:hypothetical protein
VTADELRERIESFGSLEPDWGGEGGRTPSPEIARSALALCE